MQNSSYKIFCLIKRVPFIFKNKEFSLFPTLYDPVAKSWYESSNPYIKNQCWRIYNEIENSYYSFESLVSFLIARTLWDKNVIFENINDKNINTFKSKFAEQQLEKDRKNIDDINKEAKFKHIRDYFGVLASGESLIYQLCMNEIISLYFFIYYANTALTGFFERAKLRERDGLYADFIKTMDILTKQMNLFTHKNNTSEQE